MLNRTYPGRIIKVSNTCSSCLFLFLARIHNRDVSVCYHFSSIVKVYFGQHLYKHTLPVINLHLPLVHLKTMVILAGMTNVYGM